jgi:transcriptional regulator with XRE-family HTH domain
MKGVKEMAQTFGERLRYLRRQRGWSQRHFAAAAGVNVATLNALELGTRSGKRVAVEIAQRLARTLGVSLDYLSGMYDEVDGAETREEPTTAVPVGANPR